jgi:thioredoxin-dependent peroxiredoxin
MIEPPTMRTATGTKTGTTTEDTGSQSGGTKRGYGDPVRVGDQAPDFTLPDQTGRLVSLRGLRGRTVVLYFYPRDHTMLCTAEACDFRDAYEMFAQAGAEIVGISSDPPASHRGFATQHALPFLLLSDVGGMVRERYGVPKLLGILPGRVTYVIDAQGIVSQVIQSAFSVGAHVQGSLRSVQALRKSAE